MSLKHLLINLGKLLLCGLAFSVGAIIGGTVATSLGLQPPQLPEGLDPTTAMRNLLLTSPLPALALALVARGLTGGFLVWASRKSCQA